MDADTTGAATPDLGPLAADLDEAQRALLVTLLHRRPVTAGEVLIQEGDRSDALSIVLSGELSVTIGHGAAPIEVARVGRGGWVGEVAALDPGPATATVTSLADGQLLQLSYDRLVSLIETHPAVGAGLVKALSRELAERVRATSHGVLRAQHEEPDSPRRTLRQRLERLVRGIFGDPDGGVQA